MGGIFGWDPVGDLGDAWETVKEGATDLGDWLAPGIDLIAPGISDLATDLFQPLETSIKDALGLNFDFDIPEITQKYQISQILDPNYTLPVVYGETEIGGNIIFYDTTGDNNKYLDIVVAIAEGEIESFTEVYLNDEPVPLLSDAGGLASSSATEQKISTMLNPIYDGYVECYLYTGTSGQTANSQLTSSYFDGDSLTYPPALAPYTSFFSRIKGWSSNHKLTDVVYAYFRFTHNPDIFSGSIPRLKFKIKGRKVYDPRTSTTIYSSNPAVCLYDYLTNSTYSYGKKLSSSEIDVSSFITAANDCDVLRDGFDVDSSPVTYKTYELAAITDNSNPVKDNIPYFLQSMNASLPYVDGTYFLKIAKAGSAVVALTEDDIIGSISVSSTSKNTRYNSVIVSFADKERHYKIGNAPISNATYLSEDNGEKLETSITVPYVDYFPRAADLANLVMNLSRAGKAVSFTSTMKALKATANDIVSLTHTSFGWTDKLFRITNLTMRPDGLVEVSLVEHENSFYTLTDKYEKPTYTDTRLQSPLYCQEPSSVTLVSDNTTIITTVDGQLQPRIYASWVNVDNYTQEYYVYLKKSADASFIKVGQTKDSEFYISPVDWGVQYDVGISAINGLGFESIKTTNTITIANPLAGANYDYPDVKGLELIGEGISEGKGNDTNFTGKDIKLQWRLSSSNVTFEFGSSAAEAMGGAGGVLPFTLKGYRVEVYHPADVKPRQEYFVTQPNFIYSLDKNIEDGDGTPSRTVTFKVYAVGQVAGTGISGESEVPAKITVTNPAPDIPSGLSLTATFKTLYLDFNEPSDADYKGTRIWVGTSSGFTRNASSLVYQGPGTKHIIDKLGDGTELSSGVTYYVYIQTYDDFGYEGTESVELSATTIKITGEFDIESQSIKTAQIGLLQVTNALINDLKVDKLTSGNFTGKYINITSGGNIRSGQTAYDTGTGFWIGDVSGTPKFSLGNSAGNKLLWDGSSLTVTGTITASRFQTATSGQRVDINPSNDNEIHFYGDRGDTTVEELATIGISGVTDPVILRVGSASSRRGAISARRYQDTIGEYGVAIAAATTITASGVLNPYAGVFSATGSGGSSGAVAGIRAEATNGIAAVLAIATGTTRWGVSAGFDESGGGEGPLWLDASSSASAPTHTAALGTLWVTSAGILYINTSGSTTWQKVGAQ